MTVDRVIFQSAGDDPLRLSIEGADVEAAGFLDLLFDGSVKSLREYAQGSVFLPNNPGLTWGHTNAKVDVLYGETFSSPLFALAMFDGSYVPADRYGTPFGYLRYATAFNYAMAGAMIVSQADRLTGVNMSNANGTLYYRVFNQVVGS